MPAWFSLCTPDQIISLISEPLMMPEVCFPLANIWVLFVYESVFGNGNRLFFAKQAKPLIRQAAVRPLYGGIYVTDKKFEYYA